MHLDSLHVAVPAVASGAIGISSGTKEHDDDYWRRLKQFKDLWGTVESIADKGKVGYLGSRKLVICANVSIIHGRSLRSGSATSRRKR